MSRCSPTSMSGAAPETRLSGWGMNPPGRVLWRAASSDTRSVQMRMIVGRRKWLRSVLTSLVCLWLGTGPVLASNSLWEATSDCCCGSGSACLLGGCSCGVNEARESSPCGGLRSAEDYGGQATVLSFGLHLGLVAQGIPESRVGSIGEAPIEDVPMPEPQVRSLEPPPPRFAWAR